MTRWISEYKRLFVHDSKRTKHHVTPDYVTPDHVTPDHVTPDYVTPDHVTPDHVTPDHVTPDHVTPDYVTPDYVTPDYVTPDYVTPDHITPDHVTPTPRGIATQTSFTTPTFAITTDTAGATKSTTFCRAASSANLNTTLQNSKSLPVPIDPHLLAPPVPHLPNKHRPPSKPHITNSTNSLHIQHTSSEFESTRSQDSNTQFTASDIKIRMSSSSRSGSDESGSLLPGLNSLSFSDVKFATPGEESSYLAGLQKGIARGQQLCQRYVVNRTKSKAKDHVANSSTSNKPTSSQVLEKQRHQSRIITDQTKRHFDKFDNYSQQRKSLLQSKSYKNILSNFLAQRQERKLRSGSRSHHSTDMMPTACSSYSEMVFAGPAEECCYITGMLTGYEISQEDLQSASNLQVKLESEQETRAPTIPLQPSSHNPASDISAPTSFVPNNSFYSGVTNSDIYPVTPYPSHYASIDGTNPTPYLTSYPSSLDSSLSDPEKESIYIAGMVKGYARGQQLNHQQILNAKNLENIQVLLERNCVQEPNESMTEPPTVAGETNAEQHNPAGTVQKLMARFENELNKFVDEQNKSMLDDNLDHKIANKPQKTVNSQELQVMSEFEKHQSVSVVDELKNKLKSGENKPSASENMLESEPVKHFGTYNEPKNMYKVATFASELQNKLTESEPFISSSPEQNQHEENLQMDVSVPFLIDIEPNTSDTSENKSKTKSYETEKFLHENEKSVSFLTNSDAHSVDYEVEHCKSLITDNELKKKFADYNNQRKSLVQSTSFKNMLHGVLTNPAPQAKSPACHAAGPHPALAANPVFRNNLTAVIQNKLASCNIQRTKNSLADISEVSRRELLYAFYNDEFKDHLEEILVRIFEKHCSVNPGTNAYSEISGLTDDIKSILSSLKSSLSSLNSNEQIQHIAAQLENNAVQLLPAQCNIFRPADITKEYIGKIIDMVSTEVSSTYAETSERHSTNRCDMSSSESTSEIDSTVSESQQHFETSSRSHYVDTKTSSVTPRGSTLSESVEIGGRRSLADSTAANTIVSPRYRSPVLEKLEPGEVSQLQTNYDNLVTYDVLCLTAHGISVDQCWLYWKIVAITALSSIERDGRIAVGDVIFEVNNVSTRGMSKESVRILLATPTNDRILKLTVLKGKRTPEVRKRILTTRSIARFSSKSEFIRDDEIRYSTRFKELCKELDV